MQYGMEIPGTVAVPLRIMPSLSRETARVEGMLLSPVAPLGSSMGMESSLATICAVTVVPTFAPRITPTLCASVITPDEMKQITANAK